MPGFLQHLHQHLHQTPDVDVYLYSVREEASGDAAWISVSCQLWQGKVKESVPKVRAKWIGSVLDDFYSTMLH